MTLAGATKVCLVCARVQLNNGYIWRMAPVTLALAGQVRTITAKHWAPKWRKLRAQKTKKFDLPDYQKLKRDANMTIDQQREHYKKEGIEPPRRHQERDTLITSTNTIFESYVPPEGDGVASLVSGERAKQSVVGLGKKGKSYLSMRKIRKFEEFDPALFAEESLDIYKECHELLQDYRKNETRLHELVTERAYPEMIWKLDKKTVHWEYITGLEPPRVVHVRSVDALSKDNVYGQVTVRFHTQQILAVYDRFGRLMYGSDTIVKDTLEYVVFEKHISDENSRWRIHGKIIPDWMPQKQTVLRTMRIPNVVATEEGEDEDETKEGDKAKELVV
ncbi:hypothetical protein LSH36_919g01007 [Paralvinella palmiformis]|uniref:Large ribosomal subunit protein mL45 n=1 Tax=Paralvinella palmiformis TaxID=53620 RepID=A0AAD9IXY2_9ANNE|nr:hypothetical protein LSH36_919g01007 [Paralvinella palmiformis]